MRFLCDVHISIQLCKRLSEAGHDCTSPLALLLTGIAAVVVGDHGVWERG